MEENQNPPPPARQPPPITFLTDDLLLKIYAAVTSDADRKTLRSTSKTFARIDSLHRTHLKILRLEYLTSLLTKFPGITSLDLSACPRLDDSAAALLLSGGKRRIHRLNLSRCTGLRVQGLERLMRWCECLVSVDVSYCCGFGDREVAALGSAAGLREICLDKCLGVGDVGLAQVAVGCSGLESLSLKWCVLVSDIGIELLSKICARLKRLDISYLKVTNESLRSISTMEKLEVLQMVGCGSVNDMGLDYIGKGCPSLKVLDVSRCDKLSSTALASVIKGHSNSLLQLHASQIYSAIPMPFPHHFEDLKRLKVLGIDGAHISDTILENIGRNCGSMSEIGLGKCVGVTDAGILLLVSRCSNLKVLNLTCCSDISDSSLLAIASSCRGLLCLQLECCNLLTENGLYFIGSYCSLLQEIDLTDCSGIDDTGLQYLSKCSELVSLKLGLCDNISDKGLFYIASNCVRMRELDLYRCIGIGDDGLEALSRGCKKIRKLILSYCAGVTDRGLGFLGSLEELSDLELRAIQTITGTGLRMLAAGCRRLAQLDLKHCQNINDSGFLALAYYSRNLQQINFSGCHISDVGLCMVMGTLTRIQDAKLVKLKNVSVSGLEVALKACSARLKKLKLVAPLRQLLSPETLEILELRGCKIRWD